MILARLHGRDRSTGASRSFQVSERGYQDWTDPTPWYALLDTSSGGWSLTMADDGATRVTVGSLILSTVPEEHTGIVRLAQADMAANLDLPGWPVELYDIDDDRPFAEAVLIARLTIDGVDRDAWRWTIRIRQPEADLDLRAAGKAAYAATDGSEGAGALTDKGHELLLGRVRAFTPTYLGQDIVTGCHRWSVSGGRRIAGLTSLRQQGYPLVKVAGTPADGQWSQDVTTGLILTGPKNGSDIIASGGGLVAADGHLIERPGELAVVLAAIAGGPAVNAADAAALDAAGYPLERWIAAGEDTGLRGALDEITSAADAVWYIDALGEIRLAERALPADAGITWIQEIDFDRVTPATTSEDIPVSKATVHWGRAYTTVTNPVDAVSADDKALLAQEWQDAADAAATAPCPVDKPVSMDSRHSTRAGAVALAHALRTRPRASRWTLATTTVPRIGLGAARRVLVADHPVFGTAPVCVVRGVTVDFRRGHSVLVEVADGA